MFNNTLKETMKTTEIKFRVWKGYAMENNVIAGNLGAFYIKGMDEKDPEILSSVNTKYHENTPVMQFTGLQDKNGKDMYEFDIVKTPGNQYRIIVWESGCFHYRSINWKPNSEMATCPMYFISLSNDAHYEVVGDIYSTPDLLKS